MGAAAAIAGAAVVGAGASIYSAGKGAKAQKQAAELSTQVQREQNAEAQREYNLSREDLAPFREAGYTALGQLGRGTVDGGEFNRNFTMADFNKDPGYEFRRAEGQRGVEASAAARGGILSGGTLKALDRYNQDYASQEYGTAYNRYNNDLTTRFNRLSSLAGTGQTATNTGISASQANVAQQQQGVNNITNNIAAAGNARASQYVSAGNAVGNAAGQVGNYVALKSFIGNGGGYGSTPGFGGSSSYGIAGSDGIY